VRKLLDRHVIGRLSDAVIAVSSEDRRRMIEIEGLAPDKVRRIPNGAPDSPAPDGPDVRAELGIPAGAPVLGSVGMLRPRRRSRSSSTPRRGCAATTPTSAC
jgi:hypothetical protein